MATYVDGKKRWIFVFVSLILFNLNICHNGVSLAISHSYAQELPELAPRPFLDPTQYTLLEEILTTHLNYFLSNDAITSYGFPLGGYQEGYRAQYNYSNPTEWGYAVLAWITAADRGIISLSATASKIETALDTMIALQDDPSQNYGYLFYPYYYVTTDPGGIDQFPQHDGNLNIPSIDNGFLYTSLLITKGWAMVKGLAAIENKAADISDKMDFRVFLKPSKDYMAHVVNASTGELGSSAWNIYADEGGMMAWIAYVSDSISLDEYKELIGNMKREPRQWNNIVVKEAPWYNAMFTWGVRSLSGLPVASWETATQNQYSAESFAKAVKGHLAFGSANGVFYPAFSDAMTQPNSHGVVVGQFIPPNIPNSIPSPVSPQAIPHAFFVPFTIGPDLDPADVTTLIAKITALKNDTVGYYHDGSDGHKPFGFEVTSSTTQNNASYVPPVARYTFETLSAAYTVLSLQQGLNIHDGLPTFLHYAAENEGYLDKVQQALSYLYSATNRVWRVPGDYTNIQDAINAAASGDTVLVATGTYIISTPIQFNRNGVTLAGENQNTILTGSGILINCSNLSGDRKARITGFTFNGGASDPILFNLDCEGTASSLLIDNNKFITRYGIHLRAGASLDIKYNTMNFHNPIRSLGNNYIRIIGNNFGYPGGGLQYGISLIGGTGLIQDNNFTSRWDGALAMSGGSDFEVIRNRFVSCGSWFSGAGMQIDNSTAKLRNNLFAYNNTNNGGDGAGIISNGSTLYMYNNIFYNNQGSSGGGNYSEAVALRSTNSNLTAKNNIFMNNNFGTNTIYIEGGSNIFSYNDFWNNTTTQLQYGVTFGLGNIYENPLFVDTTKYKIQHGSPAEDAGDPDSAFKDLNDTRNDMGIHGGPYGDMHDYVLNMIEMPWNEVAAPYNSTGAAAAQMILDYIVDGPGMPRISQNAIYEYAKSPAAFGPDLSADEMDKVLGHFDPYDTLVSNWADVYDALPGGNPYQGYNYTVDSYPVSSDAINQYMRDIAHWMAYTVPQGNWWDPTGPLVARPNTPAAVPILGSYNNWVAVKGFAVSNNPCPEPRTNPYDTPGFIVYGFWTKDPRVSGIGENTYKTAAECSLTYFKPLSVPGDPYNGEYVQIAEPPAVQSYAEVEIQQAKADKENLEFIEMSLKADGEVVLAGTVNGGNKTTTSNTKTAKFKQRSWRDLVDKNLLTDSEAVAAFEGAKMARALRVRRMDITGGDYYLVPFQKKDNKGHHLVSGVIILSAEDGSFKEASWTETPEKFLRINKNEALSLVRDYVGVVENAKVELIWDPLAGYSHSPYQPYWKIDDGYGSIWYVTQQGNVVVK